MSNESNWDAPVMFDNFTVQQTTLVPEVVDRQDYYAFGLTHQQLLENPSNRYLYNGKELVSDFGLNVYDYIARNYDPATGRFWQVDPLADLMSRFSPYTYSFDNPIRFTDPDGMKPEDVIIKGQERQAAFSELQTSVKGELDLSMDGNGRVTYNQSTSGNLSEDAQQLVDAIDNSSIIVNVNAENTTQTKSGDLYIGGAYSGNTVISKDLANAISTFFGMGMNYEEDVVAAEQEVNPSVLEKMSTAHGKPGADMLHEVTEAYQGALISQNKGESSPASNQAGSVYPRAHSKATNQSGRIYERIYDASGRETNMLPGGGYPAGISGADWYVKDRRGNKVVIQQLK